ncbi:MAG: carbamoyltransferase HypF, partial [Candidatus Bathyarchaeia archaeon]
MRAEVFVKGIVQGVGFRPFVYRIAVGNKLFGFVRNQGDAGVRIVIEGKRESIENFLKELKFKKPPLAQIFELNVQYLSDKNEFKEFSILESLEKKEKPGSIIPPDISICEECLKEMKDKKNRRFNYFFITCTDCGPRYTIIDKIPYDRENTTMRKFKMCTKCKEEYVNPLDRRFHAQTIACPECGPRVSLVDEKGIQIDSNDPIREAGKLLEEGFIVAIKGNGGFHIATATTRSDPIVKLRKAKHRSQKPFAIMARDLETVKSFAKVSHEEAKVLTSSIRPIVLLKKSEDYYLSDLISPKLHTIGVMLPYTGLHEMLFEDTKEPAFIMTSANPPDEPIVIENSVAYKKLRSLVDFFLFHDRYIAQRCDDSVLRVLNGNQFLIRRSRGYSPAPIKINFKSKNCIVGLGAEENVSICVLIDDKAYISQYIGNVETIESYEFLKETTSHMLNLLSCKIDIVVCDLHPKFLTTRFAKELAEEYGCKVFQVQHHHAHLAALMAENGLDEIVGIACDGLGYGIDGSIWGGEIFHCSDGGFKRIGHLQEQPMVGGDLATRYPIRMTIGILHEVVDISEWALNRAGVLPYGSKEVELILKQLRNKTYLKTSSCGRVLDAVSALLDVCYERTYEGEPAMKLESIASHGNDVLKLEPIINGNVIDTTYLLENVFKNLKKFSAQDLAYSAQEYIAKSLAQLAIEEANRLGVDSIGFSGGVAYNEHITSKIHSLVNENKLK